MDSGLKFVVAVILLDNENEDAYILSQCWLNAEEVHAFASYVNGAIFQWLLRFRAQLLACTVLRPFKKLLHTYG